MFEFDGTSGGYLYPSNVLLNLTDIINLYSQKFLLIISLRMLHTRNFETIKMPHLNGETAPTSIWKKNLNFPVVFPYVYSTFLFYLRSDSCIKNTYTPIYVFSTTSLVTVS